MRDNLLIQKLKEAIRRRRDMPDEEWFQEMVQRGVLDEKGRVLIRMPEPPKKRGKKE
jgi:hypothetical protein